MKKRLLSALLAAVMAFSMMNLTVLASTDADAVVVVGDHVEAPLVENSTVSVPVKFTQNPGLATAMIQAAWDDSALELTSVTYGAMVDAGSKPISEITDGTYKVFIGDVYSKENYTGINETVFTLNFKILPGAEAKKYDIALSKANDFLDWELGQKTASFSAGSVTLTEPVNSHLQQLPDGVYNDTNLWPLLSHESVYYNGSAWGTAGEVYSVTIPVEAGDQIYANSFQVSGTNDYTRNGIRVTYFYGDTVVSSIGPDDVYAEYNENGYLTVPAGVNAVNIPVWKNNENAVLNLLTLPDRPAEIAEVNGVKYPTLAAAVAAAQDGDTVKLLADASGEGIVINKSITIDFNEKTYTVTYPTVGSTGTETNGFQILMSNTVTLKNGTLAAGLYNGEKKVKILVQNYSDLTVTDMVLDGTNGCVTDNTFFTLSCNNGDVAVNGDTDIIAPDGHYAIDSYNLMSPETYKEVNVTVNTTGTITGDIRAAGNKAALELEKAIVNGEVVIRKGADVVVGLEGGSNEDVQITGDYAIAVFGQGAANEASTLVVNSGTIIGETAYAISGNGSITATVDYSNTEITINGGIIKSEGTGFGGTAVYVPMNGTLTINGGEISGLSGVEVRGGEVSITGGTITATGEWAERLDTSNGATTQGVAVAVNKYDHQEGANIEITGGTITATGSTGKVLFVNEEMEGSIAVSGGSFNQAVAEEYCAEGFAPVIVGSGVYGVAIAGTETAEINGTYYATLAAAVAAAQDGDTVKLLANASGEGIVINKSITIDFNEKTYTVTYPTVGSTGTETNGFQILMSNTVTLKNGTLAAGLYNGEKKVKILVQNYSDLTVTDMVLDGTKGYTENNTFFTLSCNNGDITVNGVTNIIAPEDHYAIDSYNLMSPETYVDVKVTINTTGTITGDIRAIGDKAALDIQKGTVNGQLRLLDGSTTVIGTEGGNDADVQITGDYPVFVRGQGAAKQVTTLTVNSGTITAVSGYTISGNGSITSTYDYSNTDITINGGIIKNESTDGYAAAIYNPQGGKLTINGGTITGMTGVEVRGGDVKINGGTITATGEYAERLDYHNGVTMQGVAVAVNKYDHQTGSDVAITGGTFSATGEGGKVLNLNGSNGTLEVSGGTFNQAVAEEYCADGYIPEDNGDGTYGVKPTVPVTGVSLNKASTTITAGNTETLTATVSPSDATNKAVTWTSTNSAVATVSETGVVTAVASGTTTITVTTADGGFTATCTVTVSSAAGGGGGNYGGGGGFVSTTYSITVEDAKNGDITISPKSASKGDTVTVTVDPDDGYTLETLTVTDKNGKEVELTKVNSTKYTFKMPASKVTVKATFMDDNTMLNFFVDVPADAYYYDAVLWAAKEGITNGTTETTFSPSDPCTRAHMVTFLWRAFGSPEPTITECAFTDVDLDGCYGKAILWAVEIGIVKGTSETTFSPSDPCTRAHMATLLFRLENGKAEGTETVFTDVKPDAYYAEAVQWAVEQGITNGMTATTFGPNETCTRAHMVTFLYRYLAD